MGFHVKQEDDGQWSWTLINNDTEIAVSATTYSTEQECARAISMVMETTFDTSTLFVPKASFDIANMPAVRSVQVPLPLRAKVGDSAGEVLDLVVSAIGRTIARAEIDGQMPSNADALYAAIRADISSIRNSSPHLTYRAKLAAGFLDTRLADIIETHRERDFLPGPPQP